MFLNYVRQGYVTGHQKEICIYFCKLDINAKLNEKNEKKKIYLQIFQNMSQQCLITGLI